MNNDPDVVIKVTASGYFFAGFFLSPTIGIVPKNN